MTITNDKNNEFVCPVCGNITTKQPSLSRKDNRTYICPECGLREALTTLGIDEKDQTKLIIDIKEMFKD